MSAGGGREVAKERFVDDCVVMTRPRLLRAMASRMDTLPHLPRVEIEGLGDAAPVPLIRTEQDVTQWHRSRGFQTYLLFLHRLNDSVVGCTLGDERLSGASPVREQ